MLLEAGVHGRWEEKLDARFGLIDGRSIDVPLASVLHVALNTLFDLHDDLAW